MTEYQSGCCVTIQISREALGLSLLTSVRLLNPTKGHFYLRIKASSNCTSSHQPLVPSRRLLRVSAASQGLAGGPASPLRPGALGPGSQGDLAPPPLPPLPASYPPVCVHGEVL